MTLTDIKINSKSDLLNHVVVFLRDTTKDTTSTKKELLSKYTVEYKYRKMSRFAGGHGNFTYLYLDVIECIKLNDL